MTPFSFLDVFFGKAPGAKDRRGSALLVTLLSVSLLLVLVLMLATVVRMELRTVTEQQNTQLARANARLGLELAVALLQEKAGPDRRVTARGELHGGDEEARLWTGVWSRNSSGVLAADADWLVSGSPENLSLPGSLPQIELHSATSDFPAVIVPKIRDVDNLRGAYAFWISDEGVKASVAARRQAVPVFVEELSQLRKLAEYQSDFGVNIDMFLPNHSDLLTNADFARTFEKIDSLWNFDLLTEHESLREFSHDFTGLALGVLENAHDGGLKINLSDESYRDSFLANDELQKYLEPKNGVLEVDFSIPSDRGIEPGQPFFAPRPLLTEGVCYIGILHDQQTDRLDLRYHIEVELLNPYSMPLVFDPDPVTNRSRGLGIYFRNFPQITVTDLSGTAAVPTISHDPDPLKAWINLPVISGHPVLLPGEVHKVFESDPLNPDPGFLQPFGTVSWSPLPNNNADILIEAPAQSIEIGLFPFSYLSGTIPPVQPSSTDITNEALKIEEFPFKAFRITENFDLFSYGNSDDYDFADHMLAYHLRLSSDSGDPASMREILAAVDIRESVLDLSGTFENTQGANGQMSELFDSSAWDPSDPTDLFSMFDLFDERIPMRLYDIPDGKVFSVGQLSSLHIHQRRPRSVGNPWGEELNRAFDKYFFSPREFIQGVKRPIHPAIRQYTVENPGAFMQNSAAHEMVLGQFNINSTSVSAWASVLGAPVYTPDAVSTPDEKFSTFFRLPVYQSGGEEFHVDSGQITLPVNAFAQGARAVVKTEDQNEIRDVAENIVNKIKSRNRPFADLAEFVNSGILQEAIDDTQINNGLIEFSNVYLMQSDLMLRLAPVASTRSDTFKVRVYGSAMGANNEILSVAFGEAVVQRLPEKVNQEDPMLISENLQNMRKFHIRSFKWLSDAEI